MGHPQLTTALHSSDTADTGKNKNNKTVYDKSISRGTRD